MINDERRAVKVQSDSTDKDSIFALEKPLEQTVDPDTAISPLPVPPMHFEEGYLNRPKPPQPEVDGPSAASQPEAMDQFVREGFLVIRNFLVVREVDECIQRLQLILDNWQSGERPGQDDPVNEAPSTPLVDMDMDFKCGRLPMPADSIDAIRRFFRMAVHDEFFEKFATSPQLLGPLKTLWGNDIALLQSMGLLKPPGTGEKRWHADQGYFRLIHPDKVRRLIHFGSDPSEQIDLVHTSHTSH
jgi:hypothetical protein